MEHRKPWHLYLILAVIAVTVINVLPTIFYYTKPLREPVGQEVAMEVATEISHRVNRLEQESVDWIHGFGKHIGARPASVEVDSTDPSLILVSFDSESSAARFKQLLPLAGAKISSVPAQLQLSQTEPKDPSRQALVLRRTGVQVPEGLVNQYFYFSEKYEESGEPTDRYQELVNDRVAEAAKVMGGSAPEAEALLVIKLAPFSPQTGDYVLSLAKRITEVHDLLGADHPITHRAWQQLTRIEGHDADELLTNFLSQLEMILDTSKTQAETLEAEQQKLADEGQFLSQQETEALAVLTDRTELLTKASQLIRQHKRTFLAGESHLSDKQIHAQLSALGKSDDYQKFSLGSRNVYIESVLIDWSQDRMVLRLHPDVETILREADRSSESAFVAERVKQQIYAEVARIGQLTDESLVPDGEQFVVHLGRLTGSESYLGLDLSIVAQKQAERVRRVIEQQWNPQHPDLQTDRFPIWDQKTYDQLTSREQKLGLLIYAPVADEKVPPTGFFRDSVYVVMRGLTNIGTKYQENLQSEEARVFLEDFERLMTLLARQGFRGYEGISYGFSPEFSRDYIFRQGDYYQSFLAATREQWSVLGSQKVAILEFTDVEQRIATQNRIENAIHEDLLKWRDSYQTAQVDPEGINRLLVPPPTKNVYLENLKLNVAKYFRGDENKILKWGLDLQGGKTVRIELRDENNQVVTRESELSQAVDELFNRVNKLGVSQQTIRVEGDKIVLEFPGSQGLTAADLIKASAMYFHIVNERFSPMNSTYGDSVRDFLQGVWNEAVVTNATDVESLNQIAWKHLGGNPDDLQIPEGAPARTVAAQTLREAGLKLVSPTAKEVSNQFDDSLSMISVWRGDSPRDWQGASNPLMVTFANYALDGSSLTNVRTFYDQSKGHTLGFEVRNKYVSKERTGDPRDDFYAWTSQFSRDSVSGTPKAVISGERGWRMAVILNGQIVSAPTLDGSLRDGGIIQGKFTQREVNRLSADLKAGSLSFTPRILSETNVSPDLGREERTYGIVSALVGLGLVFVVMIGCYRFGGVIASIAVLTNLLIMWGVLQNLGAALTLPGIAGVILTIGMAVDANVLVFERMREEFKYSGKLMSALQAGYRKAFSAIVDSNLTTIIAALILIQFDAGPIKGFAITLIIGIISSMFTALFMTRYILTGWAERAKDGALNMVQLFKPSQIDFLGKAKVMVMVSAVIIAVGCGLAYNERDTMLGMEFTGGYAFTVELQEGATDNYRTAVADALVAGGAIPGDVQVKRLNKPNQLRIQLGHGMETEGRPFFGMPQETEFEGAYTYQRNPRITWVVDSLATGGLNVKPGSLEQLHTGWSTMSGQFSNAMRANAMWAVIAAMVCILMYITLRFEFKYAISAIIALTHDVFVTLGIMGMLHKLGVPMQIDLEVLGAMMTIIGYSLNDTIIIFDRVREEAQLHRNKKFGPLVNQAINVTLSRTLMTSFTTMLVLLPLVFFGGSAIFGFATVMAIGVVFGTLSSLFIACPAMLYFHSREELTPQNGNVRLKKA